MKQKQYPIQVNSDAKQYGFKAANLMFLESNRINTPENLPINSDSIVKYLDDNSSAWRELWKEFCDLQNLWQEECRKNGKEMTISPEASKILESLQTTIADAFVSHQYPLASTLKGDLMMVRSTGNEDRVDVANQGGNESMVSKPSALDISKSIGIVIASYFSHKSFSQRLKSNEDVASELPLMACLLQPLIGEQSPEDVVMSGVIYSSAGRVSIQVAYGHGELVVNSKGPFDSYYITPNDGVYAELREKKFRLVPKFNPASGKMEMTTEDNPFELATSRTLSDALALQLANIARKIEEAYGMPMDIEFCIRGQEIIIVQARAIIETENKKLIPSALDPDYIAGHLDVAKLKASVITPAIITASVIRNPDEILICDTIEQALDAYNKSQKPIKAIIIRKLAPETSHEAGFLSNKNIPVLQVADLGAVSEWVSKMKENDVLIIDPQHSAIFKIPLREFNESEMIKEGIFKSPLTEHVSPAFVEKTEDEWKKALKILEPILNDENSASKQKYNLKTFNEDLDRLLLPIFGTTNKEIKEALTRLLRFSYKARKQNKISPELFQKIAITAAELLMVLDEANDAQKKDYLDLQKKLQGLFGAEFKEGILSSSVVKEMGRAKINKKYPIPVEINDPAQREFYQESVKLEMAIAREDKRQEWLDFCKIACAQGKGQLLADLVGTVTKLGLHEYWVNAEFVAQLENEGDKLKLLATLHNNFFSPENSARRQELLAASRTIDGMEAQMGNFADPTQFEATFANLEKSIAAIDDILHKSDTENLNLMLATKLSMKMVDVIDKSIKVLQTSAQYEDQKTKQVENFRKMVEMFMGLLEKRVKKSSMEEVSDRFYQYLDNKSEEISGNGSNQLDISPNISLLGNNIYLSGQITVAHHQILSLADLHSVAHQNLISAEEKRIKELNGFIKEILPEPVKEFMKNANSVNRSTLVSIEFQAPLIKLFYNIPQRTHSAIMEVEFNTKENDFKINMDFFGGSEGGRWQMSAGAFLVSCLEKDIAITKCEGDEFGSSLCAGNVKPRDIGKALSIFNDIAEDIMQLKIYKGKGQKIELARATSKAISLLLYNDGKLTVSSNYSHLLLYESDREKHRKEIQSFDIDSDKKSFLMSSYNGLVLLKNQILTQDLIKESSLERLNLIGSDAFVMGYVKLSIHQKLLSLDDDALKDMTSDNMASLYHHGITFEELFNLYRSEKEKFKALTSNSSTKCYDNGATFSELKTIYESDQKKFEALTSDSSIKCYDNGATFSELKTVYESDQKKFEVLTSEVAKQVSKAGYSIEKKVKFKDFITLYDNDPSPAKEKFKTLINVKLYDYSDSSKATLNDLINLYDNDPSPAKEKFKALTSAYRKDGVPLEKLEKLYDEDESPQKEKFKALASFDIILFCGKGGVKLENLEKLYDEDKSPQKEKFKALTSFEILLLYGKGGVTLEKFAKLYDEDKSPRKEKFKALTDHAGFCYGKGGITFEKLEKLYDEDKSPKKEKFKALTSEATKRCYFDGVKLEDLEKLYDEDKEKFNIFTSKATQFCYEAGVTLNELETFYDTDRKKFAALTSNNALLCHGFAINYYEANLPPQYINLRFLKDMDADKIIALTSKDAQLQYHKGVKFKELEELYDDDKSLGKENFTKQLSGSDKGLRAENITSFAEVIKHSGGRN